MPALEYRFALQQTVRNLEILVRNLEDMISRTEARRITHLFSLSAFRNTFLRIVTVSLGPYPTVLKRSNRIASPSSRDVLSL